MASGQDRTPAIFFPEVCGMWVAGWGEGTKNEFGPLGVAGSKYKGAGGRRGAWEAQGVTGQGQMLPDCSPGLSRC